MPHKNEIIKNSKWKTGQNTTPPRNHVKNKKNKKKDPSLIRLHQVSPGTGRKFSLQVFCCCAKFGIHVCLSRFQCFIIWRYITEWTQWGQLPTSSFPPAILLGLLYDHIKFVSVWYCTPSPSMGGWGGLARREGVQPLQMKPDECCPLLMELGSFSSTTRWNQILSILVQWTGCQ